MAFAHCPFRELAEAHPDLVCGLHCGLVEGFVDELGGGRGASTFHDPRRPRRPCQVDRGRTARAVSVAFAASRYTASTSRRTTRDHPHRQRRRQGQGAHRRQEGDDDLMLRVAVRPGGCSGFSYEMFFDTDVADDDLIADYGRVKVVVDPSSAQLLDGRHPRLQGRPPGRRVRHRQPQRAAHLRLRPVLQLTVAASASGDLLERCPGVRRGRTRCRAGRRRCRWRRPRTASARRSARRRR